jgi:hypothetical protein
VQRQWTAQQSCPVGPQINGKLKGIGEIRLHPEKFESASGVELNGSNIDAADGEFNRYVHEVRIYDRALSGAEIKNLAVPRQRHAGNPRSTRADRKRLLPRPK